MPKVYTERRRSEIANKNKKDSPPHQNFFGVGARYKCAHCGDEIFWNTHRKLIECKCKKIWVDGCEDYVRIGGTKKDCEVVHK